MSVNITDQQIHALAELYRQALAGSDTITALQIHADKANIKLTYMKWGGSEIIMILNVFKAAKGQNKLLDLINVVENEGFNCTTDELRKIVSGDEDSVNIESLPEDRLVREEIGFDDLAYRQWLQKDMEHIDIQGIGETRGKAIVFPILTLYTELYVQTGLTNLDLEQGRMKGQKRVSLTQMVESTRSLVIMGDPGSGKTTFLRFIAQRESIYEKKFLPIYLRLSDIYDFATREKVDLSSNVLIKYFSSICAREKIRNTERDIEAKAESGQILWLLDSLDELPSEQSREEIVNLIEKAARRWDKCKFVMTSRPLPIKSKVIPMGFEYVGIDYWTEEDIKNFLKAWTSVLYPNSSEDKIRRHWGALLSTITGRADLRSLSKNAVMVTAMAVVHYNERKLPEGRADLLESLIYWLLRAKHRSPQSTYATPKFIEERYREIALAMLEAEGGRKRRVGTLWAAQVIAHNFEGETTKIKLESALEFLSREETETGVLVKRGQGDLEFWHLSFLEYLAAKEIAGKTDDIHQGWWAKLKNHLEEPEWREVLIFVPACLNRLGRDRVDLFFDRLGSEFTGKSLTTKAKIVALGGCILRDLKLVGYSLNNIQSWSNIMTEVMPLFEPEGQDIPLEIKYDAAVAYGLGGDDRLRNFDETWVKISGGRFLMGAQSQSPSSFNFDDVAADWESPVIEVSVPSFEIRKYPITAQEFAEFFEDGGYITEGLWSPKGLEWKNNTGITGPLDWEDQLLTPNCPITGVSWYEAEAYCKWLTSRDLRPTEYRLPTEAEWEYAARFSLGAGQRFPWGNTITPGEKVEANCAWSGLRKKTPIGLFYKCITKNGIVDLFGNVEEWCLDSWSPDHSKRPRLGSLPLSDSSQPANVVRGGSTIRFPKLCRPTYRSRIWKDQRYHPVGFRPIRRINLQTTDNNLQQTEPVAHERIVFPHAPEPEKYIYAEGINYFVNENDSIWGLGDKATLDLLKDSSIRGVWLDLAAGDGRYAPVIVDRAKKVVALDIDLSALSKLWYRCPEIFKERIELISANIAHHLPFANGSFDGVLCTGILHLFPERLLITILNELSRVTRVGGSIVVDFATDFVRHSGTGSLIPYEGEMHYTTEQAVKFLKAELTGYENLDMSVSSFVDDLTNISGAGYITEGKFILAQAHNKKA